MKKLYLFYDVLTDYTSGLAGAVAESKEKAINLIIEQFKKDTKTPGLKHTRTIGWNLVGLKADLKKCKNVVIVPCDQEIGFYVCGGA